MNSSIPLDQQAIGQRIALNRKARGWTQQILAEKIGITRLLLSDYERGKVRIYADILAKIASALDLPTDSLLIEAPYMPTTPELSLRLVKRIQKIERLTPVQQKALLKNIDMFLKAADFEDY